MNKNIMISEYLFLCIFELLTAFDAIVPPNIRREYEHILWDLNLKKHKMNLRDAYSKIINAKNDDDRNFARFEYLRLKNLPPDFDL